MIVLYGLFALSIGVGVLMLFLALCDLKLDEEKVKWCRHCGMGGPGLLCPCCGEQFVPDRTCDACRRPLYGPTDGVDIVCKGKGSRHVCRDCSLELLKF